MKKVDFERNLFIITFHSDDFSATLKQVQSLEGRAFNKEGRYWTALPCENNRAILTAAGFEFTARAKPAKQAETPSVTLPSARIPELRALLPGLRDYQLQGVEFIELNNSGLIADEMGLGKTNQAISYLKAHPENLPALVVCPATVKYQWRDEILKWYGKASIEILEGEKGCLKNFARFTIINYDILVGWAQALAAFPFKTIIGDEIQYIQNTEAQRTTAFKYIAQNIPHKVFLSGTPIKTRTAQFFNCLHLLSPQTFPNEYRFLHRYCNPQIQTIWIKKNGTALRKNITTYKGLTNAEELQEKIKPLMLRRTKAEVLKELPPKQKIIIPLPSEKSLLNDYLAEESAFKIWVEKNKEATKNKKTQALENLKQLAYLMKRKAVIQWVGDFIADKKLIIFAHNTEIINDLYKVFHKIAVMVDGSVKDRETPVKQFWENPETRLFIGQDQASGVGLNLQCASAVAFIQLPWTVSDCRQCEDRAHRIGQAGFVSVYFLIAEGTVELHIAKLLVEGGKMVDKLIDNKENSQFFEESYEIMDELIRKYEKTT